MKVIVRFSIICTLLFAHFGCVAHTKTGDLFAGFPVDKSRITTHGKLTKLAANVHKQNISYDLQVEYSIENSDEEHSPNKNCIIFYNQTANLSKEARDIFLHIDEASRRDLLKDAIINKIDFMSKAPYNKFNIFRISYEHKGTNEEKISSYISNIPESYLYDPMIFDVEQLRNGDIYFKISEKSGSKADFEIDECAYNDDTIVIANSSHPIAMETVIQDYKYNNSQLKRIVLLPYAAAVDIGTVLLAVVCFPFLIFQ